jgi:hypothetical protein
MFAAIRHVLFGYTRHEQTEFVRNHIYRVTRWIEDVGGSDVPLNRELEAYLGDLDRADESLGRRMPLSRTAFAELRAERDRLHAAVQRSRG